MKQKKAHDSEDSSESDDAGDDKAGGLMQWGAAEQYHGTADGKEADVSSTSHATCPGDTLKSVSTLQHFMNIWDSRIHNCWRNMIRSESICNQIEFCFYGLFGDIITLEHLPEVDDAFLSLQKECRPA